MLKNVKCLWLILCSIVAGAYITVSLPDFWVTCVLGGVVGWVAGGWDIKRNKRIASERGKHFVYMFADSGILARFQIHYGNDKFGAVEYDSIKFVKWWPMNWFRICYYTICFFIEGFRNARHPD